MHVFDTHFSSVECYTACVERERAVEIANEIYSGKRTPKQGFIDGYRIDTDFWIKSAHDGVLVPHERMSCVICWIIH